MTREEIQALVMILQRTPMTPAEGLWVNGMIARLHKIADAVEAQKTTEGEKP